MVNTGVLVRTAREQAGMSARDLATASGVSPSTVTWIERSEMNPTVAMLERLLDAAGNRLDIVVTPHSIRPTLDALRTRRQELIDIVESFGASNVRVFGSVGVGTLVTTPTSTCWSTFLRGPVSSRSSGSQTRSKMCSRGVSMS